MLYDTFLKPFYDLSILTPIILCLNTSDCSSLLAYLEFQISK